MVGIKFKSFFSHQDTGGNFLFSKNAKKSTAILKNPPESRQQFANWQKFARPLA
jgi:hypothetical protein